MVSLPFDASQVEPSAGTDPIPAGKYLAVITASEFKPTRNGAGQYLEFAYQIVEGQHQGRKLWSRHNLQHPNAQTVEIARRELSSICRAVGVLQTQDSAELHNRPLLITVAVRTRPDTGEKVNEITAWAKKEAAAGAPQQAGAAGGPQPPAWMRKG